MLFNLTNVIQEPTRIFGNSSTLINPIIVSDACQVLDSGTFPVDNSVSDHKATFVSVKTETPFNKPYFREVWHYNNASFEELNDKIRQYNWDHVINDTLSVDEAYNNFAEADINLCKACIPWKKVLIRLSDRPWFTSELKHNIHIRDRLRRKVLKSNNVRDITRYKAHRNQVNNKKKYAKETNVNNCEDMILNKKLWRQGKQSKKCAMPLLQTPDDSYVFTDTEKSNLLHDYFALFLRFKHQSPRIQQKI